MDESEEINQNAPTSFISSTKDDHLLQNIKEDNLEVILSKTYVSLIRSCIDRLEILRLSVNKMEENPINKSIQEERLSDQLKFQKEIINIVNILNNLSDELSSNATFTTLITYLENEIKSEDDKNQLKNDYEMNQQCVKYLKKDVLSKKNQFNENKLNTSRTLIETKNRLENQRVYFSMALNYATKWETARHEQHVSTLDEKQSQFELQIRTMKTRYEQELLCHNDILTFLQESRNDCLNEIQNWMDKYDYATEQKDLEIYNLRIDLDKAKEEHANLEKTYEQRSNEMHDWLALKLRRRIENRAVIKIQTWWRQVMIDKHLGPYRKKKQKKKKKKNKNKTTKKKTKK